MRFRDSNPGPLDFMSTMLQTAPKLTEIVRELEKQILVCHFPIFLVHIFKSIQIGNFSPNVIGKIIQKFS
jgi:hypothetical protein